MIKNKRKNKKIPDAEVLLNNMVQGDIQNMLFPLNLTQKIFFTSKYNIQDNFITPNSRRYCIAMICSLLCLAAILTYRVFVVGLPTNLAENTGRRAEFIVFFYFYYLLGFVIIFFVHTLQVQNNISLVLKIQDIHNAIDFESKYRSYVYCNWISILSITFVNIFILSFYYSKNASMDLIEVLLDILYLTFDMNMVYAIRIVVLLKQFISIWIDNVNSNCESNDEYWNKMFYVYQSILEAYDLHKKVFQLLILHHLIDTFLRRLCYVQLFIEAYSLPEVTATDNGAIIITITTVVWLGKDLMLQILGSAACEMFCLEIERAEGTSALLMIKDDCTDAQKRTSTNIIQLNRLSCRKFIACGLFTIDATLPLQLIALITSYVIVLLQFAFL